jgi:hypothetical protein
MLGGPHLLFLEGPSESSGDSRRRSRFRRRQPASRCVRPLQTCGSKILSASEPSIFLGGMQALPTAGAQHEGCQDPLPGPRRGEPRLARGFLRLVLALLGWRVYLRFYR